MSHVELRKRDIRKSNVVRRKIIERRNIEFEKMVGLGSEELLGSDIADIAMELEINSDDESEEEGDKERLIRSTIKNEAVNNHIKKLNTQKVQVETEDDDNVWSISIQMFIPFLLAGFGMVAASLLLDVVQVCK